MVNYQKLERRPNTALVNVYVSPLEYSMYNPIYVETRIIAKANRKRTFFSGYGSVWRRTFNSIIMSGDIDSWGHFKKYNLHFKAVFRDHQ